MIPYKKETVFFIMNITIKFRLMPAKWPILGQVFAKGRKYAENVCSETERAKVKVLKNCHETPAKGCLKNYSWFQISVSKFIIHVPLYEKSNIFGVHRLCTFPIFVDILIKTWPRSPISNIKPEYLAKFIQLCY